MDHLWDGELAADKLASRKYSYHGFAYYSWNL